MSCFFLKNPPIAAPLLHQFAPSEQITLSLLHYVSTLAVQLLHQFNPWLLNQFSPHRSPNLAVFWPPYTKTSSLEPTTSVPQLVLLNLQIINYLLSLTSFYPHWQPNSYIFLPPLNKLPPNLYVKLTSVQPNFFIILHLLNKLPPHSYNILAQKGISPKFVPLQPNAYIILHPMAILPPHSYINLPP